MAKINIRDRNKGKAGLKPNYEYRFETAKVDGKRKSISKSGFRTKKEALEAGSIALAEYQRCGDIFNPTTISLSDYMDSWLETYCRQNVKQGTLITYKRVIDHHIKPELGKYRLSTISPAVIQAHINKMCKQNYSKSLVQSVLSIIKFAFAYAEYPLELVKQNPALMVRIPKQVKQPKERNIISDEDYNRILKEYPFGSHYHVIIKIAWHCGLRISEICGLLWDDIDFESKTISVNKQLSLRNKNFLIDNDKECVIYFSSPKCNSYRVIKADDVLLATLKKEKERQAENERLLRDEYVKNFVVVRHDDKKNMDFKCIEFKKTGRSRQEEVADFVCRHNDGRCVKPLCTAGMMRVITKRLGINYTFHSFRHTHATKLIDNGVNPKVVQQRLGHKDITTTLRNYVHVTKEMEDEAVKVYTKGIDEKNGGQNVDKSILQLHKNTI